MSTFTESFFVEEEHDMFFPPNGNSTRSRRVVGSNPIWGSDFFSEFPFDAKNVLPFTEKCIFAILTYFYPLIFREKFH